uniref:Galectin n=2 Tax=Caenorhabditis tropicalis TaxID=1561998 RepID=A0A1I7UGA7_9PELO
MILLFLFLFQVGYAQNPASSQQLFCNRLVGNFNLQTVRFGRPLQNGDMITWSGWIGPRGTSIRFSLFSPNQFTLHIRQDLPQQRTAFSTLVGPTWMNALYGPPLFQVGQPFLLSVKLVGNSFQIFTNNVLRYTYPARSPVNNIISMDSTGSLGIHWIEQNCVNPPVTTRVPRPSRRPGRGGRGRGGRGRGGRGRFGSSSDSDERY